MQTKAPKKNKILANVIIIFIILALLLLVISSIGDFNQIGGKILESDVKWIVFAFIASLLSVIILSISNQFALRVMDKNMSYLDGFYVQTTESFYSGITPFGSGAQPFQIYDMTQKGVEGNVATAVSLVNFIMFQAVTVFAIIAGMIVYWQKIYDGMGLGVIYILVGVFFNTVILILLLLLGYSKKFKNLVNKILNFFVKFKWSKRFAEKGLAKSDGFIINFQHGVKAMMKRKRVLITSSILKLLSFILKYGSIIFIVISLNITLDTNTYIYITISAFVALNAMMWVPLPGASGGVEFALGMMLVSVSALSGDNNTILLTVILLWRFATYYFQLFLGFIAYLLLRRKKKPLIAEV